MQFSLTFCSFLVVLGSSCCASASPIWCGHTARAGLSLHAADLPRDHGFHDVLPAHRASRTIASGIGDHACWCSGVLSGSVSSCRNQRLWRARPCLNRLSLQRRWPSRRPPFPRHSRRRLRPTHGATIRTHPRRHGAGRGFGSEADHGSEELAVPRASASTKALGQPRTTPARQGARVVGSKPDQDRADADLYLQRAGLPLCECLLSQGDDHHHGGAGAGRRHCRSVWLSARRTVARVERSGTVAELGVELQLLYHAQDAHAACRRQGARHAAGALCLPRPFRCERG